MTAEQLPDLAAARSSLLPAGGRDLDHERALRLAAVLAPDAGEIRWLVIAGEPASKARPRFTKTGKPYRTKEDVDAEARTAWNVRTMFKEPWTGNVGVGCVFFRPGQQRIDVDNMLKHVCDAANKIAWVDDSQITAIYGIAELDADNPRTILVFVRHESSLRRGTDETNVCQVCGKDFHIGYGVARRVNQKYCTKECSKKARGHVLDEPVPCGYCGTPFKRTTTSQRMCSPACRYNSFKHVRAANTPPMSSCAECGKELRHRRGGRCRDCWRKSPQSKPDGGGS